MSSKAASVVPTAESSVSGAGVFGAGAFPLGELGAVAGELAAGCMVRVEAESSALGAGTFADAGLLAAGSVVPVEGAESFIFGARVSGAGAFGVSTIGGGAIGEGAKLLAIAPPAGAGGAFASV